MFRLFYFIVVFLPIFFWGQSVKRIDSLSSLLSKTKDFDKKSSIFIRLSVEYDATDLDKSFNYAKKALNEARKNNNVLVISEAYNNLANVYEYRSLSDSSLVYHEKALILRLKIGNSDKIGDSYNNIGIAYDKLGNFPMSLENYFKALRYYEKVKDIEKQAMTFSNIGIVYKAQKEYQKTLEYYYKANKIYHQLNSDFGIAVSEGNIGAVLLLLKKYKQSIVHSSNSKKTYEKIGYDRYVAYPLINIAIANDSLKNHDKAMQLYKKSIQFFKRHQNNYEVANTLNAYAKSLQNQKMYNQSLAPLLEALEFAKKSNAISLEIGIRKNLANAYAKTDNLKEAYNQMQIYSINNDSLFNQEKTKAIAEAEAKYQSEKKEKDLVVVKNNLLKEEIKTKRKNILLTISVIILTFGIIISFLVYRTLKLKNKQQKQEYELTTAISKIETQNKLQEQRLSISRDLHDNIGAQLTFIISSVETLKQAFNIKDEKINSKLSYISTFTKDTITELRDTIWAMNHSEIDFNEIKIRILNFVEKAQKSNDLINLVFERDFVLDDIKFTSVEGMNIYRITQEAVNNAMKYSEAKNINLTAKIIDNQIEIKIVDDGKGFDIEEAKLGNGIRNMQKRASELNADLEINSEKGNGTSITLRIPKV